MDKLLQLIMDHIELLAILLAPAVAVVIGEWLRNRNYKNQQKDDLLRRLVHYGYQLSPTYSGNKNEILGALNEIKYWYYDNYQIKALTFKTMDTMNKNMNAQDLLIELLQAVSDKGGRSLSRQDIERVFSPRKT